MDIGTDSKSSSQMYSDTSISGALKGSEISTGKAKAGPLDAVLVAVAGVAIMIGAWLWIRT